MQCSQVLLWLVMKALATNVMFSFGGGSGTAPPLTGSEFSGTVQFAGVAGTSTTTQFFTIPLARQDGFPLVRPFKHLHCLPSVPAYTQACSLLQVILQRDTACPFLLQGLTFQGGKMVPPMGGPATPTLLQNMISQNVISQPTFTLALIEYPIVPPVNLPLPGDHLSPFCCI